MWLGTIAGFGAGFVVAALLHNYPKDQVTRHRYCQVCGEYEETYSEGVILGARSGHKQLFNGPVGRLLKEAVGDHEHRYSEWATIFPTFGVPQEHPEIGEEVLQMRAMDDDPHAIAALEQAMRNDKDRTVKLIQRILDPAAGVSTTVVMPLEQAGTWEEKWAKVDAELAKDAKKR
jgi:hypothetical protein